MLVAHQKLKENIAEYIIYMYHIEDIIRAFDFDLEAIIENYVKPQLPDQGFIGQYREWYSRLILQMQDEKIEKSGHLLSLKEYIIELNYLHKMLIEVLKEEKYIELFERTIPTIEEFAEKSNLKNHNHIEVAFHSQYMKLLLKLRKQEISAETEEALDQMRFYLAYLSKKYHQMKQEN
ncbi:MAG: hypothetical protein BGO87_09740 [Flavobacteriia bacterium 40-80]|nr:MAG: hypothetical protein BGO87_09740 [Flavobacteriia bacterium 40-80]